MPRLTIIFGIVLIALGVVGYMGGPAPASGAPANTTDASNALAENSADEGVEKKSFTAFIPAIFGALLCIFGLVALKPSARKHAMHGAVLVGLMGALAGGGRAGSKLSAFLSNDPSLNRRAFLFVAAMTIVCMIYVVLCIRSFVAARKRAATEG